MTKSKRFRLYLMRRRNLKYMERSNQIRDFIEGARRLFNNPKLDLKGALHKITKLVEKRDLLKEKYEQLKKHI